jgi:type IV pilus assembly protein PilN
MTAAIRINLLPHRELRRAQLQRAMVALMAGAAVAGLAIVLIGHVILSGMQSRQTARNAFLQAEIAKLDVQIAEIAKLKEKTNSLLARKQVVETLQVNRAEVVHLFDELARQLPDGMYLKSLKQTDGKLTLTGYAQSSARVSALMRNIESSEWLDAPQLVEVKVTDLNKARVNEFSLDAIQTVPGAPAETKAGTP